MHSRRPQKKDIHTSGVFQQGLLICFKLLPSRFHTKFSGDVVFESGRESAARKKCSAGLHSCLSGTLSHPYSHSPYTSIHHSLHQPQIYGFCPLEVERCQRWPVKTYLHKACPLCSVSQVTVACMAALTVSQISCAEACNAVNNTTAYSTVVSATCTHHSQLSIQQLMLVSNFRGTGCYRAPPVMASPVLLWWCMW